MTKWGQVKGNFMRKHFNVSSSPSCNIILNDKNNRNNNSIYRSFTKIYQYNENTNYLGKKTFNEKNKII